MQKKLIELYAEMERSKTDFSAVVGFDGFIDEIIDVVDKRGSFTSYRPMASMNQFADRVSEAAGLSTNIELVTQTVKIGGNGPILANALLKLGADITYIGALGRPTINPVFAELEKGCSEVYSLGDPGRTQALEFGDGKVMLGNTRALDAINWAAMREVVGEARIKELFSNADLIATVDWTAVAGMNDVWEGLLELIPAREGKRRPYLFIDLADLSKRNEEDVLRALELIQKFNSRYKVVLGLNRREASQLTHVLGLTLDSPPEKSDLVEIVTCLGEALRIWCLMVHPVQEAAAVSNGQFSYVKGPYTSRPRLTTGAGDNFNAGFCLGLMLQFDLEDCLILGSSASGFYVRNGYSPTWDELVGFLKLWSLRFGQEF